MNLPLRVIVGKKKYPINLNAYRNWHFHVSNQVKKKFKEYVAIQTYGIAKIEGPVGINATYWFSDRRSKDVGNIHSIVEKFTLDALVEIGLIPDDGIEYVRGSMYVFGGYREIEGVDFVIMHGEEIQGLGVDCRNLDEIYREYNPRTK